MAVLAGASLDNAFSMWVVPLVAGLFLALTGGLLVWDLKRPDRFYYLLIKGNPGSWLVKGAYILSAYAALMGVWFLAGVFGYEAIVQICVWVGVPLALALAGYTAFLFGQAEARDLWQSPMLLWHMIAGAFAVGGGFALVLTLFLDVPDAAITAYTWTMIGGSAALGAIAWGELVSRHPTRNITEAVHHMTQGQYRTEWWVGGIMLGVIAPVAAGAMAVAGVGGVALSALGGLPHVPESGSQMTPWSKPANPFPCLERFLQMTRTTRGPNDIPRLLPGAELTNFPPSERWDDWEEYDAKSWPTKVKKNVRYVPTTCFNCESACGLLAVIDKDSGEVRRFEGNPEHPGSRGRNCAKGPATLNQMYDPERILYPMKRVGERGSGEWERVTWEDALQDIAGRMRTAIQEERHDEIMYHVGRPGEDGFMDRTLKAWGVDGHNSHTNICSAGARTGYAMWMGHDRPSADFANAQFILLLSSHLETGHYFNPHAQRIMEGKQAGAKLATIDPRLSNTASMSDIWVSSWPGTEPAMLLAVAKLLLDRDQINREFMSRWMSWEHTMANRHPDRPQTFDEFILVLKEEYAEYTPEWAAEEAGVTADKLYDIADGIAKAGTRFSSHTWRSAGSGNLGGWQTARCLWFLHVLTGSIGTVGGTAPSAWDKFKPTHWNMPPTHSRWNEMLWPKEYPFAHHEMSFLLPYFLKEGRGKVDVYFTRVYNPVWTNPDGFSWIEVLTDEEKVGLHVAMTPTWSETAWYADYVLPMGVGSERHDTHSYETHMGQWLGFRQPVLRVSDERDGKFVEPHVRANPGEVWEETEFWIDLSWRVDPDGSLGIKQVV